MQKVKLYTSPALRLLFLLLCIAWAILIFSLSAETADESDARSLGIASEIAPIVVPDYEKMPPASQQSAVSGINHVTRKAAHFALYTGFGVLLCLACFGYAMSRFSHIALPLAIGACYALTDELHQRFVPERGPGFTDVLLDSAGVLCGVLIAFAVAQILLHARKKREKQSA